MNYCILNVAASFKSLIEILEDAGLCAEPCKNTCLTPPLYSYIKLTSLKHLFLAPGWSSYITISFKAFPKLFNFQSTVFFSTQLKISPAQNPHKRLMKQLTLFCCFIKQNNEIRTMKNEYHQGQHFKISICLQLVMFKESHTGSGWISFTVNWPRSTVMERQWSTRDVDLTFSFCLFKLVHERPVLGLSERVCKAVLHILKKVINSTHRPTIY